MCIFTGDVEQVSETCIFARGAGPNHQHLAYSMTTTTNAELAMVLPLPVPPGLTDQRLEWTDLSGYPQFFRDLKTEFYRYYKSYPAANAAGQSLPVTPVGRFEASFVPSISAFSRLDKIYRLSPAVWDQLTCYRDYGFAVFQLQRGEKELHPIAFKFPRRDRSRLYFPTLHVHDGAVRPMANFDHTLYAQSSDIMRFRSLGDKITGALSSLGISRAWYSGMMDLANYDDQVTRYWLGSRRPTASFLSLENTKGLVDPEAQIHQIGLAGTLRNTDCVL